MGLWLKTLSRATATWSLLEFDQQLFFTGEISPKREFKKLKIRTYSDLVGEGGFNRQN
jgi:hypothetical protein